MSKAPEPAIKSYFFGKGYSDLRATIADSWQFNVDSASGFAKKADFNHGLETSFFSILNIAAAFSVIVFGTLFFLVVSILHVTVLLFFFTLIYLMFTCVYLSERVYLLAKGFSTVCPHCHAKRALPEYHCDNPKCTHLHRRLIPSSHGIFRHTCLCGQKLPATFFLNRGRLQSRCGECAQLLPRENTESRKLFVAVMGGPSVGKSSYLFSTVWKLLEEKLPQMGLSHDFIDAQTRNAYDQVRKDLLAGRPPVKTTAQLPRAFNIMFKSGKGKNRLLYFYDPAGEAYADADSLVLHKYQDYLSGCIFLIDPFSIPYVRQTYMDDLAANEKAIKPGPLALDDALSRVLLSLEEHYGLSKTDRVKFPIAVVISKLDACDLENQIGDQAVQNYIRSSAKPVDFETGRDAVLRRQLEYWGQGGFVQRLESRFSRIHYFACSALGRLPQGAAGEFQPRGVLDPLLWIFSEVDQEIPTGLPPSTKPFGRIAERLIRKPAYALAAIVLASAALWLLLSPASPRTQNLDVTLSPDKTMVKRGTQVALSAQVSSDVGHPLKCDWQTSGGRLESQGMEARLDTSDVASTDSDSSIQVSVTVSDGERLTGYAQQTITVESELPPAPAPPADNGTRSAEPPSELSAVPVRLQAEADSPARRFATLVLSANVAEATVLIDGVPQGSLSRGAMPLRLPAGRHEVQLAKPGYRTWLGVVHLLANQDERLSARLEAAEPTPQERALQLLRRADQLLQQRQYDEAIAACSEGLRWDPTNRALQAKKSNIERAKQILDRPMPQPSHR